MNRIVTRWYSGRLHRDLTLARWGHWGRPLLLFPSAGGDALEGERMGLLDSIGDLVEEGRVKVYSCDSAAGAAIIRKEGDARHLGWLVNAFQEYVRHEVVPAVWADCGGVEQGLLTAGASVGAFNALAVLCRYPDVFTHAVGMSGTYDLGNLIGGDGGEDLFFATPLHFLPGLGGDHLETLRQRFAILASGEGRWEDIGHSWRLAHVLGSRGVHNRVDPWGPRWDHDWPTWRAMLPQYLRELS